MIKIICENCGKEFEVIPYRKNTAKYCSIKCKCIAQIGKTHSEETKRKMSIAHIGLKHSEESKRKLSIAFTGEKNPNFGIGKTHSEETKREMSKARKEFCLKYPEKNPMLGKKHLKETIRKIKLARAKQVLPVKDSSIEVKIQNFLKELGITFFTHQYMKIKHGYQCDILIPSMNLVIECDGDYWHKYPIGNSIDHIRTKELIENGFNVLRLWENEINSMDIDKFEQCLECVRK